MHEMCLGLAVHIFEACEARLDPASALATQGETEAQEKEKESERDKGKEKISVEEEEQVAREVELREQAAVVAKEKTTQRGVRPKTYAELRDQRLSGVAVNGYSVSYTLFKRIHIHESSFISHRISRSFRKDLPHWEQRSF
jgi:hypothetical protein